MTVVQVAFSTALCDLLRRQRCQRSSSAFERRRVTLISVPSQTWDRSTRARWHETLKCRDGYRIPRFDSSSCICAGILGFRKTNPSTKVVDGVRRDGNFSNIFADAHQFVEGAGKIHSVLCLWPGLLRNRKAHRLEERAHERLGIRCFTKFVALSK